MTTGCALDGIVVTPGATSASQTELAARFRAQIAHLPDSEDVARLVGFVHGHSGIETRHIERPRDADEPATGWRLRVNEATLAMSRRALQQLFRGEASADDCDALIAVSSTYDAFPSLTRRVQQEAGFRDDARCYDLTGLGCAGPTHGIELGHLLLERGACEQVCVLFVDAMGTYSDHRRHTTVPSLSQVVAHCLASDGAAAILLRRTPSEATRLSWRRSTLSSRLWRDALDQNDLTTSEDGEPFLSVGKAIRTRILDELRPLLEDVSTTPALFHPGGAALMRALSQAYPTLGATLALSSDVLRRHGNIGSASLIWVLHRALEAGRSLATTLRLFALGPGIVSTALQLDGVEMGR